MNVITQHAQATRALLKEALEQYKAQQPDEYEIVALAAQRGAHFTVTCALSPAGLDEVQIELVAIDGHRVTLMNVERFGENTTKQ